MPYPVTLEIDFVAQRSRVTTFLRLLLAIPLLIIGFLYGIAGGLVVIVAWFVLLLAGRWPPGMYHFVGGVLRFTARANAYVLFAADRYPPLGIEPDDAHPVRLRVEPPIARYSRLKVLFRPIYVIPAYIAAYLLGILAAVIWIASWFVIVVTARQPAGLQSAMFFCLSYTTRAHALMYLLTETYPPLGA